MMKTTAKPGLGHDPLIRDLSKLHGQWAILGGTFDPITTGGHVGVALELLKHPGLGHFEGVLFVPAFNNPLKSDRPVASDQLRLELICLELAPHAKLFVSTIEFDLAREKASQAPDEPIKSYTVDTLRALRRLAPRVTPRFVFGADQLKGLAKWHELKEVFKLGDPIMFGRGGLKKEDIAKFGLDDDICSALAKNFIEFDDPSQASMVRALLQAGNIDEAAKWLSPPVLECIVRNKAYIATK